MESEARLAAAEIGGKREEQERRRWTTGSESHLVDGASVTSLRQSGELRGKDIHAAWKRRTRKQKGKRRMVERYGNN